jgi:hypothetical protein
MNRHNSKLDKFLGQEVTIEFKNNDIKKGLMGWNSAFNINYPYIKPFTYYLLLIDGSHLCFRKSHVRRILSK